jgi:predicted permease
MEILASAVRSLRAHPWFAALVIALLALGIGANTALFSVIHAVLLKPLPYPEPGQLVLARKPPRDAAAQLPGGGDQMPDNEFLAWIEAVPKSFRGLAAYRNSTSSLQLGDGAVRVPAAAVTGEFFPLLGVSAWRGRLFEPADLAPGAPPTTVLSYAAWQSRFAGDDAILGQVVKIDDAPHTVIGVLPPTFEFIDPVQFWRPLQITPSAPGQLRIQLVRVFGRLLPTTSIDAAQRELDGISERFWNNLSSSFLAPPPPSATVPPPPASVTNAAATIAPAPNAAPAALPPGARLQLPPGVDANDPAIQRAIAAALAARGEKGASGPVTIRRVDAAPATADTPPTTAAAPTPPASPTAPTSASANVTAVATPAPGGPAPRIALPFAGTASQLVPLQEQLVRRSRATLWLLLAAVGFVLLIACANLANLQLARAATRRREIAVRAALGASPARLAVGLLAENLLLALAGGALGLVLAWWGTLALSSWLADYLPRVNTFTPDATVLGFAALLAALAGLAFGLAPAWQGTRVDLLDTLKDGGTASSPRGTRWRQGLVALEVALALVLAVNTGLLARSLHQLYSTDLGYRTSDVMTANLSLPIRYAAPAAQRDFADRWLTQIRALPGVQSAALTDAPPLAPYGQVMLSVTAQGSSAANASVNNAPQQMALAAVTPDYFAATGIALRQGRFFTAEDGDGAPFVALVNEAFVKQYYPQGLTLGAQISLPPRAGARPAPSQTPATAAIVGVVADTRPRGFESAAQPLAYFPLAQHPRQRLAAVVHFAGDAATLARGLTQATHRVDAGLALDQPATLEAQLARQNAPRRITLALTGAFAATAVVLAALGLFGVMSYTVTQRTTEIGVRMALGADQGAILRWMLAQGGGALALGLAAGLALTFATSRLLATFLVGVTALDPLVLAVATVALAGIGLLACWLPARRAARVDPLVALRAE